LRHTSWAALKDCPQKVWNERTALVERFLAATCELCGSQDHVQVHHFRRLSNLRKRGRKPKPGMDGNNGRPSAKDAGGL
jgi:hypothetical protein